MVKSNNMLSQFSSDPNFLHALFLAAPLLSNPKALHGDEASYHLNIDTEFDRHNPYPIGLDPVSTDV